MTLTSKAVFLGVALAALALVSANAQEEKPGFPAVSCRSFGGSAGSALEALAEAMGYRLKYRPEMAWDDKERSCWFFFENSSPADAAAIVAEATGAGVSLDHGRRVVWISDPDRSARGGEVKGYDVSVLATKYVDYATRYGGSDHEGEKEGEAPAPGQRTATEILLATVEAVLWSKDASSPTVSAIGDRLVCHLDNAGHGELSELLDLMKREGGGESEALSEEDAIRARLAATEWKSGADETPVTSLVAQLCVEAGVGFCLNWELSEVYGEEHVTLPAADGVTVATILEELLSDAGLRLASYSGVAHIGPAEAGLRGGYRVFDAANLLDKLARSYQRQNTPAGSKDGFQGGISRRGGVEALRRMLEEQLEATGNSAEVEAYGPVIVVLGGRAAVDAAVAVLKETGWEEQTPAGAEEK